MIIKNVKSFEFKDDVNIKVNLERSDDGKRLIVFLIHDKDKNWRNIKLDIDNMIKEF